MSPERFFQPWTLLEIGIYALAILFGTQRRLRAAVVLTVVATLNRETGPFVPLLYAFALPGSWRDRKRLVGIVALEVVWFSIFAGLRVARGPKPHPTGIAFPRFSPGGAFRSP